MNAANVLRAVEVVGFVLLALAIPASIRVHARPGREKDSWLLAACVWCVFAAAIAAIIARWGHRLDPTLTVLRLVCLGLGVTYIVRNRPTRRPPKTHIIVPSVEGR